jgi:peptide/nickel transport system permease protein
MWAYLRRNPSLLVGLILLGIVLAFAGIGRLVWDTSMAAPLSAMPNQGPSWEHPLGTDRQGRDILAMMIVGPLTLYIGVLAGLLGVIVGTILALLSGYFGGIIDSIVRGIVDVGLTIPPPLVLILVAVSVRANLSISQMALVVASLAWLWPARTIRSQVFTLRERAWAQVARLSGASHSQILFFEVLLNLLPYLMATFVGAVTSAILASIGLEVIGLGPMEANTLGMTIYWVSYYAALLHGMWWWFLPPIVIIIAIFVSLFAISAGLDEFANPRRRRAV